MLSLREDITLGGTGLIAMSGGYRARIVGKDDRKMLTVGPGITIRDDGLLGFSGSGFGNGVLKLVNQGAIEGINLGLH